MVVVNIVGVLIILLIIIWAIKQSAHNRKMKELREKASSEREKQLQKERELYKNLYLKDRPQEISPNNPLKFFSEKPTVINAECPSCTKVLAIKKEGCYPENDYFLLNPPIKCLCGTVYEKIQGHHQAKEEVKVKCPKCGSTQIVGTNKGFSVGKAVAGDILLGPIGILGGAIGSKKIKVSCLNCGTQWFPKK